MEGHWCNESDLNKDDDDDDDDNDDDKMQQNPRDITPLLRISITGEVYLSLRFHIFVFLVILAEAYFPFVNGRCHFSNA